jgi:hypothetical protein
VNEAPGGKDPSLWFVVVAEASAVRRRSSMMPSTGSLPPLLARLYLTLRTSLIESVGLRDGRDSQLCVIPLPFAFRSWRRSERRLVPAVVTYTCDTNTETKKLLPLTKASLFDSNCLIDLR